MSSPLTPNAGLSLDIGALFSSAIVLFFVAGAPFLGASALSLGVGTLSLSAGAPSPSIDPSLGVDALSSGVTPSVCALRLASSTLLSTLSTFSCVPRLAFVQHTLFPDTNHLLFSIALVAMLSI